MKHSYHVGFIIFFASAVSFFNIFISCNISSFSASSRDILIEKEKSIFVLDAFLQKVYNYRTPSSDELLKKFDIEEYCGSSPDFGKFFSMPGAKDRSLYKEDQRIYEKFFKNNVDVEGTYIELGAFDGHREANTRFFDVCLSWKGLLLEGNPRNYEKLVANRPNAHRMSFAPSCIQWNETITFYDTPYTNAGVEGHAKVYESKDKSKTTRNVQVPCGPLGPVIEHVFPSKLDLPARVNFFSLDVEGSEKLVLDTIDFSRVQIDVFMIEVENSSCNSNDCEVRKQVRKMMNDAGYEKYEHMVRKSDVYVHPNFVREHRN